MSESLKILSAKIGSVPVSCVVASLAFPASSALGHEKQESAKKALLYLQKIKPCFDTLSGGGGWFKEWTLVCFSCQVLSPAAKIRAALFASSLRDPCDQGKTCPFPFPKFEAPQRGVVCSPSTGALLVLFPGVKRPMRPRQKDVFFLTTNLRYPAAELRGASFGLFSRVRRLI